MVSTFTPNIQLEEPARGDDVGTWDTPVNSNMTVTDLVVGGIATITLNNSPVVLSAAQFRAKQITFNSTLTGSVAITFPTSFTKSYEIQNICTGSSAFVITLTTTAAGGQVICCPPGETIDCFNDGANLKYKNLGRVGSYWDYGGSSVPAWVSGCSVAPYLNCDGSVFSAVTFPSLAVIFGGTTLPDLRGRSRAYLNQGTTRLISSNGGVDGNTLFAGGGADTYVMQQANVVPHKHPIGTINAVANSAGGTQNYFMQGSGVGNPIAAGNFFINDQGVLGSVSNSTYTGSAFTLVQPIAIGGITMIRSA